MTDCTEYWRTFFFFLFWITFSMGIGILIGWSIWKRK